jgi:hypothetical protein
MLLTLTVTTEDPAEMADITSRLSDGKTEAAPAKKPAAKKSSPKKTAKAEEPAAEAPTEEPAAEAPTEEPAAAEPEAMDLTGLQQKVGAFLKKTGEAGNPRVLATLQQFKAAKLSDVPAKKYGEFIAALTAGGSDA